MQPDQGEQSGCLRLGRHELVEQAGQPFRFLDEVAELGRTGGGKVALVE